MMTSANPEIQRLLGVKNADGTAAGFGTGIGLSEEWVVQIVKAVGNYGEIFERNVGLNTPLKIARGKNALWTPVACNTRRQSANTILRSPALPDSFFTKQDRANRLILVGQGIELAMSAFDDTRTLTDSVLE